MTDTTPTQQDRDALVEVLTSDWLAKHDRAAKAEAWQEGLGAGADRWCDSREFGEKPVNPYDQA